MSKQLSQSVKKMATLTFCQTKEISHEPMSLAMAYLPYNTTLEMNIYYAVLNKIALGEVKERDLFNAELKVEVSTTELRETHFNRINEALKNMLNAKLSLIDEHLEFCRHLAPIIGTEYNRSTGRIVVTLNREVWDEYLNMVKRGYTSYRFWQMLKLSRCFSKRLYEILSGRYLLNEGKWDINFEVFKRLLGGEKYSSGIFVLRALQDTVDEFVKKDMDLRFDYNLVRGSKNRIERIIFDVKKIRGFDDGEASLTVVQNRALVNDFKALASAEKNALIFSLIKDYSFKKEQIDGIMSNENKMALFFATNYKISFGLLNVRNKTRYMATVLGFKSPKSKNSKGLGLFAATVPTELETQVPLQKQGNEKQ
jgi:plasmid replication initiation protein